MVSVTIFGAHCPPVAATLAPVETGKTVTVVVVVDEVEIVVVSSAELATLFSAPAALLPTFATA
jgi:hypothetical protein